MLSFPMAQISWDTAIASQGAAAATAAYPAAAAGVESPPTPTDSVSLEESGEARSSLGSIAEGLSSGLEVRGGGKCGDLVWGLPDDVGLRRRRQPSAAWVAASAGAMANRTLCAHASPG